jgi:asparagine synthase (glutamine-hydrolysing)
LVSVALIYSVFKTGFLMSGNLSMLERMRAVNTANTGSILVCRNAERFGGIRAIQSRAVALGFAFEVVVNDENLWILHHHGDWPADGGARLCFENGDFILSTGFFCFRGDSGSGALRNFYNDFDASEPSSKETIGHFVVVVKKNHTIFCLTDQLSTCKIYRDVSSVVFSTSFLLIAGLIGGLSIDRQGCYEYAWNGVTSGERTFLDQVCTVPLNHVLVIRGEVTSFRPTDLSLRTSEAAGFSVDELVEFQLNGIRSVISSYANLFGDRVNLSMSGGYDSRLLLALLLEAGVRPNVFTYGAAADPEVRVVEAIAAGEGLPLKKIDKNEDEPPDDQFYDIVCENLRLFDGWKAYGSIFDNGVDALDRAERVKMDHVKINGSGGEIYRNFFYLLNSVYSTKEVVWSFYAGYSPSWCTSYFDVDEYEQIIAENISSAIGANQNNLERAEVEMIYPLFRTRFWTARDVSLNLGFGPALFPFMEPRAVAGTFDIPIKWKSHGRFEGRMIRRINPRLAGYPSSYGYSFASDPSLPVIMKDLTTYLRPPYLRKFSYRLQHFYGKRYSWPIEKESLSRVIDISFPFMRPFFHVEKINDADVLGRVATMEFICQKT